jgi:hypothetical protein
MTNSGSSGPQRVGRAARDAPSAQRVWLGAAARVRSGGRVRMALCRFRCTRWCASLALILPLGCGDPPAPAPAAGEYVLADVAGDPLPAVLFTNDYARVLVLADTVRLRPGGTGTETGLWQNERLDSEVEPTRSTARRTPIATRRPISLAASRRTACTSPTRGKCECPCTTSTWAAAPPERSGAADLRG